jgi:DNA polymerase
MFGWATSRESDPDTSEIAADSIRGAKANALELKVLSVILANPQGLTGQEVTDILGLDRVTTSPRFAPLCRKGLIVDSGIRRTGPSGRPAIVWRSNRESSDEQKDEKCLAPLERKVSNCQKCAHLAATRTNTVFGEGDPHAEIAFIGEAPGEEEDRQGKPFVGRAGELLTQVINRLGFYRRQVYICNVLKCRPDAPSGNRKPTRAEMQECLPYLKAQLGLVQPKVLVILGGTALEALLEPEEAISRVRGQAQEWEGIPAIPTWHPAYVLRNPSRRVRGEFWRDCLEAVRLAGYEIRPDDADWLPRIAT